ncbi:Brp/Blh family beta-carotene 15,15'-dioxygenase [Glaciimonas immobilis]|uniref:Probable beta-carotene 15,15'-dioxygenase n=1 Tax=Glaciimonas immobilis TaxID=728004 RepID=A0A840RN14_9BURK|nr:Brp/Blh family beta-carotene 15,15'-dioxygenase [Glaciimonas immobilis]KAF3996894.1 beta-carotene 15,15'-dioxygenase, Brp/Blh family [Glaciimonas immobilis]MBB5199707.1 Brp/Blh family beta-carotene 15,15'-monooxygenase [Glaciimonas immobilis]
MTALRIQGLLFCAIAIGVAATTTAGVALAPDGAAGLLLAAPILLLGVPHGALDTVFAEELHGVHGLRGWFRFALAYLGAALLVLLAWQYAPQLSLAGFLLLSALHFSGDLAPGTRFMARLLYGGAFILLPALLHASEMARLFAFLVSPQGAAALAGVLHELSGPWLLATAVAAACQKRTHWLTGVEMAAAAALALLAPPLLAFAVFFCIMHSARHIVRTWHYVGARAESATRLGRAALLPMLGTLVLGGTAAYWMRAQPIEAGLMRLLFVGLAALTVPHMALVEQARWSGWINRRAAGPGCAEA